MQISSKVQFLSWHANSWAIATIEGIHYESDNITPRSYVVRMDAGQKWAGQIVSVYPESIQEQLSEPEKGLSFVGTLKNYALAAWNSQWLVVSTAIVSVVISSIVVLSVHRDPTKAVEVVSVREQSAQRLNQLNIEDIADIEIREKWRAASLRITQRKIEKDRLIVDIWYNNSWY